MSISYTCFDGESSFSHALSLTTTGVNTSRLNRLEHFVSDFPAEGIHMSGEALHSQLDEIERIHGLYSPAAPWDWLLHWPVVHLLFFWAVARWK